MAPGTVITTQGKERIRYIDAMRGITMALVVYGHIVDFGVCWDLTPLNRLLATMRMPLFFFISGYVGYRAITGYSHGFFARMIWKKAQVQLIPSVVFTGAFCLAYHREPTMIIYWFTWALFFFLAFYFAVSLINKALGGSEGSVLGCMAAASVALCFYYQLAFRECGFMTEHLCISLQFFTLGLVARRWQGAFNRWMRSGRVIGVLIVIFTACLYLNFDGVPVREHTGWVHVLADQYAVHYSGLLLVYALFLHLEGYFARRTALSDALCLTGRRTLDVYMFHSFLPASLAMLCYLFHDGHNTLLEIAILVGLAAATTALCLLLGSLVRLSPLLGRYLLGASPSQPSKQQLSC